MALGKVDWPDSNPTRRAPAIGDADGRIRGAKIHAQN
jgi:hypothetical protein